MGNREKMGSSHSKERPSKVLILGTNACSPAFESLLLEAYLLFGAHLAARACKIYSHHSRNAPGKAISWALGEG